MIVIYLSPQKGTFRETHTRYAIKDKEKLEKPFHITNMLQMLTFINGSTLMFRLNVRLCQRCGGISGQNILNNLAAKISKFGTIHCRTCLMIKDCHISFYFLFKFALHHLEFFINSCSASHRKFSLS